MTSVVRTFSKSEIGELIIVHSQPNEVEINRLNRCLLASPTIWAGFVNGKLVAVWGLIPPTLMSEQAYLWLFTTEFLKEHEFTFIRKSQRMVEDMLKSYATIIGHTKIGNERAMKWIRWLGGTYGEPQGDFLPFIIRRK